MIEVSTFVQWLDYFGVVVFALSGALMAGRYRLDPFGVIVLAGVTAIGGGTVRDIILGALPVFWFEQTEYIVIITLTALFTIALVRKPKRVPKKFLLVADAFGLALFAVLGAQKALAYDAPPIIAVMMGIITGVFGGLIRDVLCNVVPMILRQEIYAVAALVGSALFVGLIGFGVGENTAMLIAIVCALCLRLVAIYKKVSLPAFQLEDDEDK